MRSTNPDLSAYLHNGESERPFTISALDGELVSRLKQASQNPEFYQLFYALGQLAPYCATGHKTTFGLG